MSLRNRLQKLEQSAHECPTCGRAFNASNHVPAEDIAWAKERLAYYRGKGMTEEQLREQLPTLIELANMSPY